MPDPDASTMRPAAARRSASIRSRVSFLAETRSAISPRSSSTPMPSPRADGEDRHRVEAVEGEQASYVVDHRLAPVLGHRVDVVEDDDHDARVRGQRREVAVVDRGVGVLLRVEDPDQQVGELDEAVDLEVVGHLGGVVVGQVEQHHALEVAVDPRASPSSESRIVWWRGGMPSHSSSSSAPALPHTQAVAHDVVGRRTPVEESSRPVSALNVEDLPEPVAPAIATTVCSAESRSRPAARPATCSTSSRRVSSSRPAPGGDRGLEALDARADVGAARHELAGAFEQTGHGDSPGAAAFLVAW